MAIAETVETYLGDMLDSMRVRCRHVGLRVAEVVGNGGL